MDIRSLPTRDSQIDLTCPAQLQPIKSVEIGRNRSPVQNGKPGNVDFERNSCDLAFWIGPMCPYRRADVGICSMT